MKKVIWYLHPYAGAPNIGMSYRPYHLACEFQQLNFEAYVVAANFHHLLEVKTPQKKPVRKEYIDGVPYLWLKTPSYKGNKLGRVINMFSYALRLRMHVKQLIQCSKSPDVIIVSSSHPFHYFSARSIAKKFKAKLIFEVRDLWPSSLTEILGVSKLNPLILLLNKIEKKAYEQADYVVSLLANGFEYMQKKGLNKERFIYIPNGTSTRLQKSEAQHENFEVLQNLKKQNKFIVGYMGAHGVPNALDQLIDAMALLQQQGKDHIHAVLVGKGLEKKRLQEKAKELRNVSFLEPIHKPMVANFLREIDVAFVGWKKLPIYKYGISANKIFDYMLAAKPIINAIDSKSDPIQEAGCGIIVEPENPSALMLALDKLSQYSTEALENLGMRGRAYVLENHEYSFLAKKYSQIF